MKITLSLRAIFIGILSLIVLAACQTAKPTPQAAVVDIQVTVPAPKAPVGSTPYTFKTSDAGFVTVHGMLLVLDPNLMLPAPDDAIYLVPMDSDEPGAMTIPQFREGTVPQADVNEETGEFVFTNIKPGRYVVVVRTMGDAQIPARIHGEGSLAFFTFEEKDIDTTYELNNLSLP